MSLFPGQPALLDDFNRADENPLSKGGAWAKFPPVAPSEMEVVGATAMPTSTSGLPASYWIPSQWGGKVAVAAAFAGFPFGDVDYDLYACADLLGSYYSLELSTHRGILSPGTVTVNHINLRRVGSWFHSCSLAAMPSTIAVGQQYGLFVNGRSIEAWYDDSGTGANWTLIDSADDAALSGAAALPAGYVAFGVNPAGAVGLQVDNVCAEGDTAVGKFWLSSWAGRP
jgi:hypothetical protein